MAEEAEGISFEDGDFEVVDECIDDEVSAEDETKEQLDESSAPSKPIIPENKLKIPNKSMDNSDEPEIIEEVSPPTLVANPLSRKKPTDFSADIALNQMSDQELMKNLNELETIVFDVEPINPPSMQMEAADISFIPLSRDSPEPLIVDETQENTKVDVIVLEDQSESQDDSKTQEIDDPWYTEKIESKQAIVKERFSKLARVLKFSYPAYQSWLERTEEKIGTPVCKLEPPRRCLLTELHINRWKFVCSQKSLVEPAEVKEGDSEAVSKKIKKVWHLDPCAATGVNANNSMETIPDFVMRAVKVFEEFANALTDSSVPKKINTDKTKSTEDGLKPADTVEEWLWLLVRCNSKKELMIFATGKYIEDTTIDGLKTLFETGRGKDCNVKSLYCKSLTKAGNVQTSNTIFLVGSEALDESIGSLKIQLAPKTNFWLSTSGAAELAKTVEKFLVPNNLTTVVDIGCGLGLLGLTMAKKCNQVIGVDTPSEVEEAEMTCELNNIKNASFIMGEPFEVMTTLSNSIGGFRSAAIVNGNSNIGRTVEIMTGLRKIPTLRRVVMVTTMTKQSVRSILELTKPGDDTLGDPFMPTRAVVVDTLPTGPQFEVVIRMDRKPMPSTYRSSPIQQSLSQKKDTIVSSASGSSKTTRKLSNEPSNRKSSPIKKDSPVEKREKKIHPEEAVRGGSRKLVKNPFHDKNAKSSWQGEKRGRSRSRSRSRSDPKLSRTIERHSTPTYSKKNPEPTRAESPKHSPKRKHTWDDEIKDVPYTPWSGKKPRKRNKDLRSRLSSQRSEPNLIQKMEEQQKILEVAKRTLTGSGRVDKVLARQVEDMIDTAIQQTSQIQSQLPRSVWDRIAPADQSAKGQQSRKKESPPHTYDDFRICHSAVMLEPNLIVPINEYRAIPNPNETKNLQKPQQDSWNHDKNHWDSLTTRRSDSRNYNDHPSNRREPSPQRRLSPPRRYFSSPRNSPPRHRDDEIQRQASPPRRHSPPRRPVSPPRYMGSPRHDIMSRLMPPIQSMPMTQNVSPRRDRPVSPLQRPLSPKRVSPPRFNDDWDIPSRGAVEQHTNWQRSGDNSQQTPWNVNLQVDNFRKCNVEQSWDKSVPSNKNWNSSSLGCIKPSITPPKNQWRLMGAVDSRFSGPGDDNWNIRGKEMVLNPRSKEVRGENNQQRWEPPQVSNWKPEKEEWNDLPEDARDPWGDDGPIGIKDRWNKFDNIQQGNWKRDCEPMEWSGPKDNWQNKGSISINTNNTPKPQWLNPMRFSNREPEGVNSMTQNLSIPRWNVTTNDVPNKNPTSGNWQQNQNSNNSWRLLNFASGFQLPQNYNFK